LTLFFSPLKEEREMRNYILEIFTFIFPIKIFLKKLDALIKKKFLIFFSVREFLPS